MKGEDLEINTRDVSRTMAQWLIEVACVLIAAALMVLGMTSGAFSQVLPPPQTVVSTIPANGDLNPYGLAIAPLHVAAGFVLQHDSEQAEEAGFNL